MLSVLDRYPSLLEAEYIRWEMVRANLWCPFWDSGEDLELPLCRLGDYPVYYFRLGSSYAESSSEDTVVEKVLHFLHVPK